MRIVKKYGVVLVLGMVAGQSAYADQVIPDDAIAQGSLCVGVTCADGEAFGFDTIRIKSDTPQVLFEDTSSTGSFPNQDWLMGAGDDDVAAGATFLSVTSTTP